MHSIGVDYDYLVFKGHTNNPGATVKPLELNLQSYHWNSHILFVCRWRATHIWTTRHCSLSLVRRGSYVKRSARSPLPIAGGMSPVPALLISANTASFPFRIYSFRAQPDDPRPLEDSVIMQIAAAHSKTPAQVTFQFFN